MQERLQKLLARAGYAGRLKCEELIRQGLVTVNGQVVRELGFKVDQADTIEVVGERLRVPDAVCYLFNKPAGVVTGMTDPSGRRRAVDFFAGLDVRLLPVGQLDTDTTGLLLMTNNGELANRLTHPRFGTERTYLVEAAGPVSRESIDGMLRGVWLSEGRVRAARIKVVHAARNKTVLEVVMREGRDRLIRRMLARFGHEVEQMKRVRIGALTLGPMKPGQYRRLSDKEIADLQRSAEDAGEIAAADGPGVPPARRTSRARPRTGLSKTVRPVGSSSETRQDSARGGGNDKTAGRNGRRSGPKKRA